MKQLPHALYLISDTYLTINDDIKSNDNNLWTYSSVTKNKKVKVSLSNKADNSWKTFLLKMIKSTTYT